MAILESGIEKPYTFIIFIFVSFKYPLTKVFSLSAFLADNIFVSYVFLFVARTK